MNTLFSIVGFLVVLLAIGAAVSFFLGWAWRKGRILGHVANYWWLRAKFRNENEGFFAARRIHLKQLRHEFKSGLGCGVCGSQEHKGEGNFR